MPNAPNNADQTQLIDHLFRHQFGKMVSILTRIFGLAHLETIEDAVQDTFIKAMGAWRNGIPENPEAWLTQAAKNRTIDLFRQLKSEKERAPYFESGPAAIAINELFLDREIADSQLRMIFTACHPALDPRDQIAFALKTISGFSQSEIASALLTKEESVKKRLSRARNMIRDAQLAFAIPQGNELSDRLPRVLEVLYLIFNEGFHSGQKEMLVRKELCAEAMRLCKMLVDHKEVCSPNVQALFALMCFQAARLDSKVNELQDAPTGPQPLAFSVDRAWQPNDVHGREHRRNVRLPLRSRHRVRTPEGKHFRGHRLGPDPDVVRAPASGSAVTVQQPEHGRGTHSAQRLGSSEVGFG
jgi:RNA polymerase sigma factor (sigma-70 family)